MPAGHDSGSVPRGAPAGRQPDPFRPRPKSWLVAPGVGAVLIAAGFLFNASQAPPVARAKANRRVAAPLLEPAQPPTESAAASEGYPTIHPSAAATHGSAAFRRGDYRSALALFEQAIAARPDDAESLNHAALALERLGRFGAALPLVERAIAVQPQKWSYRFNLGHIRGKLGDWAGAVAAYREADRLFPNDHATLFNLGLALQKAGADDDAIEPLTRAAAIEPKDPAFLLALGNSYQRLGRTEELETTLRRFLELAPEAPEAGRVRAALEGPRPGAASAQPASPPQTAAGL